jgi:hypothetical protein
MGDRHLPPANGLAMFSPPFSTLTRGAKIFRPANGPKLGVVNRRQLSGCDRILYMRFKPTLVFSLYIGLVFLGGDCANDMNYENTNHASSNLSETNTVSLENRTSVRSPAVDAFEYVKCWQGDKGGELQIGRDKILHMSGNRQFSFSYKEVSRMEDPADSPSVLLSINAPQNAEFLKPYLLIKFEGEDEMLEVGKVLLRGFETYEDYTSNRFVTSEYFYDSCGKLK